jgi:hypothetical protein
VAIYLEGVEGNPPTKLKRQITMTIKTYTPAEAIQAAQAEGCIEIAAGVHLSSQENIVADQDDWSVEGDQMHDFTKAPCWITTNDGQVQPIYGADDEGLIDILANA